MAQRLTPSSTQTYQRPNTPYRCGRSARWDRPCWQGPEFDGACGGEFECAPLQSDSRWHCRRPQSAGGPCASGPLPDGTCPHQRPPCLPQRSLRNFRGRISLLMFLSIVALIAMFTDFSGPAHEQAQLISPGPVASVHASFTDELGCAACHAEHEKNGLDWLAAAFTAHDQDAQCLSCHQFEGKDRSPHNQEALSAKADEPRCAGCHTEHQGADGAIGTVSDQLCANCHEPSADRTSKRANSPWSAVSRSSG